MRILFLSSTLCHHQLFLCDELYALYGDSFVFCETKKCDDFRVKNGYEGFERDYKISKKELLLRYPR